MSLILALFLILFAGTAQAQVLGPGIVTGVIQSNAALYCNDDGTTDDYVCSVSPSLSAYTTGMVIYLSPATTNTGPGTLAIDGLTATTIVKLDGSELADGDLTADEPNALFYDGTNFRMLRAPTANPPTSTLSEVMAAGNSYFSATSAATGLQMGQSTSYIAIYDDVTFGPRVVCVISGVVNNCDKVFDLNSGYKLEARDSSGQAIWTLTESTGRVTYPTASKAPKKTVWLGAGSLSTDGTQCAAPAEVTINSGAKMWTIICTDNDASSIYGLVSMPDAWDGGTITVAHHYIQTAADTAVLNGDVAASCRLAAATINNTWGSEIAIDDAAVTGSNALDITTSAAVTPNGTCTAGSDRILQFRYQLDATGTTTAVATLHHVGFKIEYSVSGNSD